MQAFNKELTKATDTNAKQILYAPVDGVVQELKINTIGGVVLEAEDIMTIVPSNEVLEVQAFPFTQYGIINVTVKGVTEDALANQEKGLFFAMQLVMQKHTIVVNGKPIALRSGMQVTAEVKTGKRRIIEYLLTPVIKSFKESVRER
jgi:hemolysin D